MIVILVKYKQAISGLFSTQISLVLFGCCFVKDVSGQDVTLTSSLEASGRKYVCPGEVVTYVCDGTESGINLYAPPLVPSGARSSYTRSIHSAGEGFANAPIFTILVSTEQPRMIADLLVQNTTLDLTIFCEVGSSQNVDTAEHKLSGTCIFLSAKLKGDSRYN